MIAFTENWWGDRLDEKLISRMRKAPIEHLEAFRDEWPFHSLFSSSLETLHPELAEFDLPVLEPGLTRPAMRWAASGGLSVLSLLLYSDSTALSSAHAAPFSLSGRRWEERESEENRHIVANGFDRIRQLRPLGKDGTVFFTNLDATAPYHSYLRGDGDGWMLANGLKRRYPDISEDDIEVISKGASTHSRLLDLAKTQQLSLVATNDFEVRLFTKASRFAWDMLSPAAGPRPRSIPRVEHAAILARTVLPDMVGTTTQIADLRSNEAAFHHWRTALREALLLVGSFTDDPEEIAHARAVLAHELTLSTRALRADLKKSLALTRLTVGVRGFGLGFSNVLLTSIGDHLNDRFLNATLGGVLGATEALAPTLGRAARAPRIIDALVVDFRALTQHSSQ